LFGDKINQLKEAGLASVNISLDTFRRERFEAMTGVDGVARVVNCISLARNAGLEVKVNTVVIRGWNDDEVVDFAKFAVDTGLAVRFIEFMPLDGSGIWAPNLVFGKGEIIEKLRAALGEPIALGNPGSEPAQLYSIGGTGIVGFIPSITEPFCGGCDRVRITSDGRFLTCLFENPGHDVKNLLRGGKSDGEIADYIAEGMRNKPEGIAAIIRLGRLRPKLNMMHEIGG
jgi:cyclic pyranopterin phosphate synthase